MQCEERVKSPRRLHSQQENRVCGLRRKSAVSAMRHLQYEWRKCAVPGGGSHLKYEKKVAQCEERAYSIRRVTSAVGGQGWWCEERSAL